MSEVRLSAETRTEFGKGGARRTRRAGKIPAVIYGHGADPRHVSLPDREFATAIRKGGGNVLLTLELDGDEQLVIPKAIQRHPIKGVFEHVDLLAVRRGEKVSVEVPLTVVGDVVPGGRLEQDHTSVKLEVEATNIPSHVEVSIADLPFPTHITAGDLTLPAGATLADEADLLLISIQEAPTTTEADAEAETVAAAPTAAAAAAASADEAGE